MEIRTTKLEHLTADQVAAWASIQSGEPALASPFFRPEFAQAVARVRPNVEVGILEQKDEPIGFFPFERRLWNRGLPAGNRLSDYHGVIAGRNIDVDSIALMRACGLRSWRFDHLASTQSSFDRYVFRQAASPCIDLSSGVEAWQQGMSASFCAEMRRRSRKLAQAVGPLRFVLDDRDPVAFQALVRWKVEQYERTGALNILGFAWVRQLLESLCEFRGSEFSVIVPALYAGDKLVAVNYMLRSGLLLHDWFSAYDPSVARFSPGIIHKLEIVGMAAAQGIQLVDFGKGDQRYKLQMANAAIPVAEGAVDRGSLKAVARSAWWALRSSARAMPFNRLLKGPVNKVFQLHGWLQLR